MNSIHPDKLNSVTAQQAVGAAFDFITKVQTQQPEIQVAAVSILYILLCEKFNLNEREELSKGFSRINRLHQTNPELYGAIRMYIEKEL